jgi:hypothetical protein
MSKNNNVNPGQYKTRGRERQGEDIVPEIEKAEYMRNRENTTPKPKAGKTPQPAKPGR